MKRRNDEYLDMRRARSKKFGINSRKNNYNYSHSNKHYSNIVNSNHVVVKITGGAKNVKSMLRNFDYDTRENTLQLYDKNGFEISLDDAKKLALDDYQLTKVKKNKNSEPRRTYRLVFSMNGKLDHDILKQSVYNTLSTHFTDHNFYYSLHPDTDNNHIHVTVMKKSLSNGKNLNINKSLLNKIKSQFAINLQINGINATFSSITDKQSKEEQELSKLKRENRRKDMNVYKVVDFGKANFNFDTSKPISFYLFMQTKNGNAKNMWNKGLDEAIKKASIKVGDYIKIKEIKDENNQSFKIKQWDIVKVENTNEFVLNDFGIANYQHHVNGKKSAFAKLIDNNGNEKIIWSKQLNQLLIKNKIKKGDRIKITIDNNKYIIQNDHLKTLEITSPNLHYQL